jgi:hypothetical protein
LQTHWATLAPGIKNRILKEKDFKLTPRSVKAWSKERKTSIIFLPAGHGVLFAGIFLTGATEV